MTKPAGSGAAGRTAEHAAGIWERALSVPPKTQRCTGLLWPKYSSQHLQSQVLWAGRNTCTGFMLMSPLTQQPQHRSASSQVSPTHLWCQAPPVGSCCSHLSKMSAQPSGFSRSMRSVMHPPAAQKKYCGSGCFTFKRSTLIKYSYWRLTTAEPPSHPNFLSFKLRSSGTTEQG